ncbi:serine/threonine/tyrosine-interacting-like protein 1 [Dunckerocampus dactyliophorus]|uniref:serine/threonine/tyrosine-interacting-like protein 1 n=1 Tax=Dunckerocampus dactyliophorus TaxID=161453 RepID=UPI0024068776|nr:serine/threonine/tyrosine-interacting-like protein 1 [Dunckerocampus dactyliophorus]XP_054655310.1 serine/threonine/tyrosine-interacting-like protein 1 [Dunckerocampus dactyliophorus]
MKCWWEHLMHLPDDLSEMGVVLSRVNNSYTAASGEPVNTVQTVSSISNREVNSTDSEHSSVIPIQSKVCEPEEVLIPALPEVACMERGYVTPQQVYNLLNAEEGQPALYDPYYILVLDCRSADRYKDSHVVTARASVTVIHPALGCLISCIELQKYCIILLYAEYGCSPVGSVKARADAPDLQRCFFQLSDLGMDPVILLGGFSAFHALYPFLCTPRMVLVEPERHMLTIYPSEILEGALYQGSATQASDYRIIKNLHITHVVNATANCPNAFPNTLCYLRLRLTDDGQQDLVEALPLASRFINAALKADPAGRVLVHCSMGRSRSSALTLAFLMQHRQWSLLHALRWLKERRACTAPNLNFLRQLITYEEQLFGSRLTSLDDIRR